MTSAAGCGSRRWTIVAMVVVGASTGMSVIPLWVGMKLVPTSKKTMIVHYVPTQPEVCGTSFHSPFRLPLAHYLHTRWRWRSSCSHTRYYA